jgi:hypothetical protein
VRHALATRRGVARLDLLLEHPDAIEALPADELFHAVLEVGLADAQQVVQLASPAQFRTFLDLAGWSGYEFASARLLPWLRAARPPSLSGEEGEARWQAKLAALDPEVLSLMLRDTLRIHDLEEEPDPELESDRFARTAEGRFIVEFLPDGADYLVVRRLVDDLYARDAFQAGRLLSAVRYELSSELTEEALRLRTGRLADLGYPSLEEALSWFARPVARRKEEAAGLPDRPPGFWLAAHRGDTLLDRAAALLAPGARARFEFEAMEAANASLVADRVDLSESDEVRGALESTRALLEMGLESSSEGDVEAAARVLASSPLKRIFQTGFGQLLELRWRAERLAREAAPAALILDSPLGEMLAAVRLRRPRYYTGLAAPQAEWGSAATGAWAARPFRGSSEVREVARALGQAEELVALARGLELSGPVPGGATVAALYLTALANERLGRTFAPTPIASAELASAARALMPLEDPRLEASGAAGALLAGLARNRASELGPLLAGERIAPGAITALLVEP